MMNTFQFISSVGGAGAPEANEGNEDCRLAERNSAIRHDGEATFMILVPAPSLALSLALAHARNRNS
jgi:hypothetical protein